MRELIHPKVIPRKLFLDMVPSLSADNAITRVAWMFSWRMKMGVRPGSDAVLHMSRIEFNELSSFEVRRLNQFETAD